MRVARVFSTYLGGLRDLAINVHAVDHLVQHGEELLFRVAGLDLELPRHGGAAMGRSAKPHTIARTASAIHSSAVGAHASIRRSAVCGTVR
jgi:hypothetical protein